MNNEPINTVFGYLAIIAGLALLILAAGELLVRIAGAIIALMIINYGMRLVGGNSMQTIAMRAWFSRMR